MALFIKMIEIVQPKNLILLNIKFYFMNPTSSFPNKNLKNYRFHNIVSKI